MGTQALISIVKNGHTFIKIVCGCNGYNAEKLSNILIDKKQQKIEDIYKIALQNKFGCKDCLVVMNKDKIIFNEDLDNLDEELESMYKNTFDNPFFNPRWKRGTADYIIILKYDKHDNICMMKFD